MRKRRKTRAAAEAAAAEGATTHKSSYAQTHTRANQIHWNPIKSFTNYFSNYSTFVSVFYIRMCVCGVENCFPLRYVLFVVGSEKRKRVQPPSWEWVRVKVCACVWEHLKKGHTKGRTQVFYLIFFSFVLVFNNVCFYKCVCVWFNAFVNVDWQNLRQITSHVVSHRQVFRLKFSFFSPFCWMLYILFVIWC